MIILIPYHPSLKYPVVSAEICKVGRDMLFTLQPYSGEYPGDYSGLTDYPKQELCMNFDGIIIGAAVFLSIGICHPLVIKMEYHLGKQSWWIWLVSGLVFCAISLFVPNDILSIIIGGFAFCCLWGIHEMFLQEKRVLRGWFPENPRRHEYYQKRRKEMEDIL